MLSQTHFYYIDMFLCILCIYYIDIQYTHTRTHTELRLLLPTSSSSYVASISPKIHNLLKLDLFSKDPRIHSPIMRKIISSVICDGGVGDYSEKILNWKKPNILVKTIWLEKQKEKYFQITNSRIFIYFILTSKYL